MTVETGPLKTGTKKEDLDPRRRETEINSVNSTEKPIGKNPTMTGDMMEKGSKVFNEKQY